ncbi:haloacid dehalogenase [Paractinoplanes abujensis]|uniref:Putative hydrolase of the HAD superfamily n=1 Tax=Paractinoplanes abujensis TaxID=882441 RepID=A0A7W7D234_9ACTN|nr:HAD family hydrolase [Actinoplanes abujensis]MBB4697880.1 putative hydrolase of the HAD superfamily [Actinoplanes abujensis]GID19636.1 haloacid dehalogenase [Actinoplanes abujensis]
MLRGVLLDLDDTLIDHHGAVRAALDLWLPELGVASTSETSALWDEVQERHMVAWRERRVSFAEQRRRRLRDFLPQIRIPYEENDLDPIFEGYLRAYESSWRRFPDVDEALAALGAAGLTTAVLTNGTVEQQRAKLAKAGLEGRVGPLFTVEDLGVAKPSPDAFRLACERIGLEPARVVSVGDRHDLDVLPARAAGLRAIHLDRRDAGPHDEPDRLTTLTGLAAALSR